MLEEENDIAAYPLLSFYDRHHYILIGNKESSSEEQCDTFLLPVIVNEERWGILRVDMITITGRNLNICNSLQAVTFRKEYAPYASASILHILHVFPDRAYLAATG